MEIKSQTINFDGSINIILGQSHFIKTVDDLSQIIVTTVPNAQYAVAFCEASGEALIRHNSNDDNLKQKAITIMQDIKAGHSFVILLGNFYPINILSKVKACDEVVNIYCATANPVTVLTVSNENGAGIIGVIDGTSPKGVENENDIINRRALLKKIGYTF
ncbi:MAG: hypothetical protein A2015_11570 [Spirochaetes bacterium GWF1_31_7]|nr:MAG: hypothetical protein A2Y30_15505 [Spirochaetes bacterium GWE1_32_154]OHD49061.1 MAG: hypothetical protein A2015_11570 [Spirochaetes bacterium GWF1_31_7]OHD50355.1 MAG: hypothetical protein A2Y29_13555 [Spirochaetes bacterium GWE2_31_10]OHD79976.1 MAG: hypothetical protein A2355_15780 [Spirochaetes bacterium RIFOXYB1_FULL_32_8]HBD93857.1 hypothetical protein [Spirochaetia bacterium]